MEVLCN